MKRVFLKFLPVFVLAFLFFFAPVILDVTGAEALAQRGANSNSVQVSIPLGNEDANLATPVKIVLLLTFLTFLPALMVSATSFTRIIIVFAFLRQSLGLQGSPPNQILIGLALFLTFAVMTPVFQQMNDRAIQPYLNGKMTEKVAMEEAVVPLRKFLYANTRATDLALMMDISRTEADGPDDLSTMVLIPAFILSELKTAFQIGFMVYIPFVVIDLIVAMVLLAMGMMVLPPVVISLPFKVMLFVIVDGWGLIVSSLVKSFRV